MKVVFAGTPEFAATALAALYEAGHEIVLVLTQPDRPAGRGMQLHASAVKQFATRHHIPVLQPASLKLDGKYPDQASQAHEVLKSTPHDVMVVAAYGLILPESVLSVPPLGCLNIHASLLPRWRGAAPIHRAIEAGDVTTGITIMQMDQGLDTGAMLLIQRIPIESNDTTGSLHDKLATLGGKMIVAALNALVEGKIVAQVQPEQGVNYAAKISKEESFLDFQLPATLLERRIRAFNPSPGAHCVIDNHTFKLWLAEAVQKPSQGQVGQFCLLNGELLIPCQEGALKIVEIQKPGSKRLAVEEFLKGYAVNSVNN
jgi:methionyl-tRNA formyltransferase